MKKKAGTVATDKEFGTIDHARVIKHYARSSRCVPFFFGIARAKELAETCLWAMKQIKLYEMKMKELGLDEGSVFGE